MQPLHVLEKSENVRGLQLPLFFDLFSDVIHNPQHYARDFYFFKRSQYPQLSLTHKKPQDAYNELQAQCFGLKFVEMGKVMLTWGILKNVNQVVQRVVFLHEVKQWRCFNTSYTMVI